MGELWIPGLNEMPDVANVYDLMLLYQEQLDTVSDPADIHSWHAVAIGALRVLSTTLQEKSFEERQVNVATNLAVVTSLEDESRQWRVEDVGLQGMVCDVQCIKLGRGAMPAIALGIDARSFFPMTDPDQKEPMFTSVTAPIAQVQYIEPVFAA
jgi:hypothetical protein